jgi:hypothetical protein
MYRAEIAVRQRFLESKSLYSGPISGDFDRRTSEATAKYQERARIEVTGELDSQTIQRAERDGFRQPTDRPDRDHFRFVGDIELPYGVLKPLSEIAYHYYLWTGKDLTVTSGTRDPQRQAEAMYVKLQRGEDLHHLYKQTGLLDEIMEAYRNESASRGSKRETVGAMSEVIERQVARGEYISRHLGGEAVDVRKRDMSSDEQHILKMVAKDLGYGAPVDEVDNLHFQLK